MDVGDTIDKATLLLIIGTLVIGFWESSAALGELTTVLDQAIDDPLNFGIGLGVFTVSMDTMTPGIPVESLPFYLKWLTVPYFFMGGEFLPHFSLWTAFFAVVMTGIVMLGIFYFTELEFRWKGLFLTVAFFCVFWWLWHVITWWCLGWGADMMGLGSANAYEIWYNAVSATKGEIIQYVFFATIPLSLFLLYRKVVTHLV